MERSITAFSFALLASLASTLVLVVQAQPGFINIDCGASHDYTDENTNIAYKMDDGFVDSGKNMQTSGTSFQDIRQYLNNNYNEDPEAPVFNRRPVFDLYIDVNYWATVDYIFGVEEIMYVPKVDDICVCLVNTGNGVPFISALELRALDDGIYSSGFGLLQTRGRFDLGGSLVARVRYPDDVYDRIWTPQNFSNWTRLKTTSVIDLSKNNNAYKWTTNVALTNDAGSLPWAPPKTWIVYLHFMEIERLSGLQREFTIYINDNQFTKTVSLEYLKPVVVVSTLVSGPLIIVSINSTNKSGNPPILNAMEFYKVVDLPNVPTAQDDVKAINYIKAAYHIKRESWQGDPCVPSEFTWDGLNCSYGNPPRIISLDLSDNQLTGEIPETLAELPNLSFLNLSGNNLIGSVPEALKKMVVENNLYMSLIGNTNLCLADPCPHKKKQNTVIVPVVTSVSGFFVVLFGALAIMWLIKQKQMAESCERTLRLKDRPFKYGEISKITGNFGRVIGEGGFGKVYLGTLDNGTVVAVKMCSKLSKQGYKEFHAEAQLLAIVHHGNLVSLVGYCDDSKHVALIYEYMANGNLRQHLSGDHPKVLPWSKRLQIAVDAAQGLDYLHNGCKPPILHRDLKTSNILLNEDLRAKIADFGLSRAFATENDSHVSTHPAGTFGYLGPEFQSSGNCDKKSDVYSFGIVLFELITGQPAVMRGWDGSHFMHILEWLIPIVESGDIQRVMDPRLQGEFDINSAWKVVEIAMSCAQPRVIHRPDIYHVLTELKESLVSKSSGSFEVTSLEIHCNSVPIAR
ncbi:putative leucine-rich repeat receptor-like serine/threonine-protein kinase At2g19230 [Eucalyptus grandis]|uniref:putative leucine-rich repeat receptor-like serine/threonine-protein kinase At2g19230 n=1 Tax=Eucalyptus grandis TaxID=71139 RepID=UPI00192EA528|nr:putative leucine-rich repeat receptor-like serine/threonine-protein kinase At2g19230 [Eucalyptus grandis]